MLEIVAAGMTFVARFEEELAPQTVAAFRAILPLEDRIIHCRWDAIPPFSVSSSPRRCARYQYTIQDGWSY